jgi:hypothetical protein
VAPAGAPQPGRRALPRLALAAVLFCTLESGIFRSGLYTAYLDHGSTAGAFLSILQDERHRYRPGVPTVAVMGDSRQALELRVADRLESETGYRFQRLSIPGTSPRCWYYMLREADPDANRYRAIVLPVNAYNDEDWGNPADADVDIHYVEPLLRLSDLFEFTFSFDSWKFRGQAFRAVLFKGLTYKRDLADFAANPKHRFEGLRWDREDGYSARYNFVGEPISMRGLDVDWKARKITHYPPDANATIRTMLDNELLRGTGDYTGKTTAYMRHWFERIVGRYRGKHTRIIFMRLPRGPLVRPYIPNAPTSAVREMGARGEATVIDEHCFDVLEKPELFHDAVHLNNQGCDEFSVLLCREIRNILGPPSLN